VRLQVAFLKCTEVTPDVRASVLSIGTVQRRVANEYPGTVNVQLFPVCRMSFHVAGKVALAADNLAASGTGCCSLNRADKRRVRATLMEDIRRHEVLP
jgi:hypothetical protein